ncbi:MAG: ribonuclease [Halanaerobiales bacterium]|nr:ribonuclease [Halanaerobiales bacterium]
MVSLYNEEVLKRLEDKLNIVFSNKLLLQRAITHKSFANENSDLRLKDNERLEFLGDSVLSIIISTYIFHNFPDHPEGELAKMRSVIVSEPSLAKKARELELGRFLLLGKGEEMTGGRDRDSILADAMEAVIGAIYLDRGFNTVTDFLVNLFKDIIKAVEEGRYIQDYKTMLQEILQKNGVERPSYSVVAEVGPDHNKVFKIEVNYKQKTLGSGQGFSKKEAEQQAARAALKNMGEL